MGLFSRRRQQSPEPYVAPEPPPIPSLESQVDEGLLILASGVRMAVKNRAVIWALRERADFDRERYRDTVRVHLGAAADEAEADADRADREFTRAGPERHHLPTQYVDEPARLQRKADVLHALAGRLRTLSDDETFVDQLIDSARDAAWEEIGSVVRENALLTSPLARPVGPAQRNAALRQVRRALEELEEQRSRSRISSP